MSPTVTRPPRELPPIPAAPQATGPMSDSACIDRLDRPASAGRRKLAVPRRVAFWLLAFVFAAAMLGTTLPTPLYVIYQARWHFSAAIVTVVFAIYAAGVLAALLLAALALIVAALAQAAIALFLAGTIVAGIAVGAVFLGSLATAHRLAPPGRRGHTISTYFVACYCGLVIPVVGVGVAADFIGNLPAVLALSVLLAALCAVAFYRIARATTPGRTVSQ